MTSVEFALLPFPGEIFPEIKISGSAGREGNVFSIHYNITGDLPRIVLPAAGTAPERVDGLWEATCMEFFLSPRGRVDYWEFNLSPSGDWNVYRLDSYREGFRREPSIERLPFKFHRGPDALGLSLECDLARVINPDIKIEAAITAVIKTADGKLSYWALKHPAGKPDFHHRESFVIEL